MQDTGGSANGGLDTDQTPATLTFNVTPVSDAPDGSDRLISTGEDTTYLFALSDFGFSDPSDPVPDQFQAVVISAVPVTGTLTINGTAVSAGQILSATDIATGNLAYTPSANNYGQGFDNLLFRVIDSGSTANGGQNQDLSDNQLIFDIDSISDAPAGSDKTLTINEDTAYTLKTTDFGFADPADGDFLSKITITRAPANGTLTLAGVTVADSQIISVSAINNGQLVFTPAADQSGPGYAALDFLVHDTGSTVNGGLNTSLFQNTVSFDVLPVNDAPVSPGSTIQVMNNTTRVLSLTDFGFTDIENHSLQNVIIDTLPASGVLLSNATPVATGDSIAAADIAAGSLTWQSASNATQDLINFTVIDNGGTANGGSDTAVTPAQLTLNVFTVNNAPSATDATVSIIEDNNHVFTAQDFGFSDLQDQHNFRDLLISSTTGSGTLLHNGLPVSLPAVIPVVDIAGGQLVFTPAANTSGTGYATLEFNVRDDGGTANGGQNISQPGNLLTIDVASVNDAPAGTDNTIVISEDTQRTINISDFGFSDTLDGDFLLSVTITSISGNGTLQLNESPVSVGTSISNADISTGLLTFAPDTGASGSTYAAIGFQLKDTGGSNNGGQDTSQTKLLTIDVADVNDAPSGTDSSISSREDTPRILTVSDFGFTDTDNDQLFAVKITAVPSTGNLQLSGQPVTTGDLINAANIASGDLAYVPGANLAGATSFSFMVVDDGGTANNGQNTDPTENTIQVTVLPVNDAPAGADSTVSATEDLAYQFSIADFSFIDPVEAHNFQDVLITALPVDGQLTNNGTAVLEGNAIPVTDIAAGNFVYTPLAQQSGIHQFSFQVRDDGGIANNGVDLDASPNIISININPVNDAPVLFNTGATYDEGSDNAITASVLSVTDPDDAAQDLLFSLQKAPANGSLSLNGVKLINGDTFTMQQLGNNELHYFHDGSETSTDFFEFSLADGGENGVAPVTGKFEIDITEVFDEIPELTDDDLSVESGGSFDSALSDVLNSGSSSLLDPSIIGPGQFQIQIVQQPGYGSVTINTDGTFLYTHDGSENLEDLFTYQITNEDGDTATATVNITAEPEFSFAPELSFAMPEPGFQIPAAPSGAPVIEAVADSQSVVNANEADTQEDESPDETASSGNSEADPANQSEAFSAAPVSATVPIDRQQTTGSTASHRESGTLSASLLVERELLQSLAVRQHNQNDSIYLFENTTGQTVSSVDIKIDSNISLSQVIYNKNFQSGLARAQSDLESSKDGTGRNFQLGDDVALSVSISTTAGVLAWMLRGGALFGSLMAATPLWSAIDPLRITGGRKDDDDSETSEVEEMFEE